MSDIEYPILELYKDEKTISSSPVLNGNFISPLITSSPDCGLLQFVIVDTKFAFALKSEMANSKLISFGLKLSSGKFCDFSGEPHLSGLNFWIYPKSLSLKESR